MSSEELRTRILLTPDNYLTWMFAMEAKLIGIDAYDIVTGVIACPPDSAADKKKDYTKLDQKAYSKIVDYLSAEVINYSSASLPTSDRHSGYGLWQLLRNKYAGTDLAARSVAVGAFLRPKLSTLSIFISDMRTANQKKIPSKTLDPNTGLVATKTPVKKKTARKTPTKDAKKDTPAKKKITASRASKKGIVTKEESESSEEEDDDEEEESSEEEEEEALLAFIHDQIALRKGTDNGNLKGEGWTAVRKDMFDRFEITFDNKQLKNQKGAIRKLYVDLKFLKNQSGFGWNAATGMVTADKGTWKELIEAHPKRKFASLRAMTIHWFDLANKLFDTAMAKGEGAVLPGQATPKDKGNKVFTGLTDSSELSKTSIKQRQGVIKGDLDESDDEITMVKQPAREPPKKRIRESKYNVLKNGVKAIVEVLRGGQHDTKPNQKPVIKQDVEAPPPIRVQSTRQEAIALMATMFLGQVTTDVYIKFIKVIESEASAEVFLSLASSTNSTVCMGWLQSASEATTYAFKSLGSYAMNRSSVAATTSFLLQFINGRSNR
ncbi:hypothetical protein PSHT_12180 [Puccinia striiformis]|uniref:Myb/SANT-like domain-containing protein n=1 Tax=Puccinia striiformis TaxID=27350 RepID=A0A2S4UY20_9BASI|nr:hypothetical protein PSHT_12180 [Puccinia striiformis]